MNKLLIRQRRDSASFRDSAGFVFHQDNEVYRFISPQYLSEYIRIKDSGLYDELIEKGYLLPFIEVKNRDFDQNGLIIKPQKIPFISYPYEWSFGQLKDAALVTLEIQKIALKYGFQLKDASAYNIQFIGTKPIFIDTLSFDSIDPTVLWSGYKQFCQHFLAPLTMYAFCDPRMKSLLTSNIDGIPLDLAISLLPKKAYFSPSRFLHLWLHAYFQNKKCSSQKTKPVVTSSSLKKSTGSALGLVASLKGGIRNLKRKKERSIWDQYYQGDSYQDKDFKEKVHSITSLLSTIKPKILWDLGANDGFFTEIAAPYSKYAIALDFDLTCIENMYQRLKTKKNTSILPLHMDLANPSPGIGWKNIERKSLLNRGPCDVVLALALIHHLLVSAAIPLEKIVFFFHSICEHLVIEFVPPSDPKFEQISKTNPNDFSFFTENAFSHAFSKYFTLERRIPIGNSLRVLYYFKTKPMR